MASLGASDDYLNVLEDTVSGYTIRTASTARFNFDYAIADVDILLRYHDKSTGGGRGRPDRELEVFKRSGVILLVTAWESYVEDTILNEFRRKLDGASAPSDVCSAFNGAAASWLKEHANSPPALANWAGEGWKELLANQLRSELKDLHTPSSTKVRQLTKRYLGIDVTKHWRWGRTIPERSCERLDELIRLRGKLTHRAKELFDHRQHVRKGDVTAGLTLVRQLVKSTDNSLGIAPCDISVE